MQTATIFNHETVVLDGEHFEDCEFQDCRMVFKQLVFHLWQIIKRHPRGFLRIIGTFYFRQADIPQVKVKGMGNEPTARAAQRVIKDLAGLQRLAHGGVQCLETSFFV